MDDSAKSLAEKRLNLKRETELFQNFVRVNANALEKQEEEPLIIITEYTQQAKKEEGKCVEKQFSKFISLSIFNSNYWLKKKIFLLKQLIHLLYYIKLELCYRGCLNSVMKCNNLNGIRYVQKNSHLKLLLTIQGVPICFQLDNVHFEYLIIYRVSQKEISF